MDAVVFGLFVVAIVVAAVWDKMKDTKEKKALVAAQEAIKSQIADLQNKLKALVK